mgnify:CR=1 FL=1
MINKIIETMQNSEYEYFGLRKDNFNYEVGDICNKSHELFQDPIYNENYELVYPYCKKGIYKGYYDAGELNGTSAIRVSTDDTENDIVKMVEEMSIYAGNNLYLIAGNSFEDGTDNSEIIMEDARIILKIS